jgi:hypothetical protein
VTADRAYVDDFAIYISIEGCGNYKITRTTTAPIAGNAFSFTGTFYANGTFTSSTTCTGSAGLDRFYIAGCGYVSGGPVSYSANWQHALAADESNGADVAGVDPLNPGARDLLLKAIRVSR